MLKAYLRETKKLGIGRKRTRRVRDLGFWAGVGSVERDLWPGGLEGWGLETGGAEWFQA